MLNRESNRCVLGLGINSHIIILCHLPYIWLFSLQSVFTYIVFATDEKIRFGEIKCLTQGTG